MQLDSPCSSGGETNCSEAYGKTAKQYRFWKEFHCIPGILFDEKKGSLRFVITTEGTPPETVRKYIEDRMIR